jgi:hypothetical protein
MKLSITTIKLLCSMWNYIEEVLEDKEYLTHTINHLNNNRYSIILTEEEKQTVIKEIEELINLI